MGTPTISFMEKSDLQESARVLSAAMLNNPLHVAVFQGNGEKERLEIEKMFFHLFQELPGIVFLAKEGQKIIGVMRMKSCDGRKMSDVPKPSDSQDVIGQRKSIWLGEWAHHDPSDLHWHLGPIGILPSHQGSGVGSRLMRRFCTEVDACSTRAYLETDLDINVRFYEKFGFNVIAETEVLGVKNRYMLRDFG
jgi:ribosomal protein S18 acetylase RimI-like enzyme